MKQTIFISLFAFASTLFLPVSATANAWNEKTQMTFAEPVEVPGQVLLPGTYTFKVVSAMADRDVVAIYNKNETHLYGIFLTVPHEHLSASGKTLLNFEERAAGSPLAIRAWFFPGDNYGHEFVYPRTEAEKLAGVNNEPVASIPDEIYLKKREPSVDANDAGMTALRNAHIQATTQKGKQVEVIEAFGPPQSQR